MMRFDQAIARAASFFARLLTRNKSIKANDFSPYDAIAEQKRLKANDVQQAFQLLTAIARAKNG